MVSLFSCFRTVLHSLDPENAHHLTIKALRSGFMTRKALQNDAYIALKQKFWGADFPVPLGLAAGFDKNGVTADAMLGYGFGFVEIGTVTPLPQAGNDRPRIFREPASRSVINRMGFPNDGALALDKNLERFRLKGKNRSGTLGINIGKNKETEDPAADYIDLIDRYAGIADYLTVNISSPNTPGLRDLQDPQNLEPFLNRLRLAREKSEAPNTPLLVKFAPDLSEAEASNIAHCVLNCGMDGVILTNTTSARPDSLPDDFRKEQGGLSGPHLKERSRDIVRIFYKILGGKIPIIGAGGIENADDAYAMIRAGANLVQLYTALIYHGPSIVADIHDGLAERLDKDGYSHISQAVGTEKI